MLTDYPGSPVRQGSTGETAVRAIQTRLAELRFPESSGLRKIEVVGAFGPATESAVKLFQAQSVDGNGNPLEIDGFVGPMTWATLFGAKMQNVKKSGSALLGGMITKASSQVGVLESPIGSNRGPQVDKYILAAGFDPTKSSFARCAAFLCWCYQETAKGLGFPNPMPKTAGILALWNKLANSGCFESVER